MKRLLQFTILFLSVAVCMSVCKLAKAGDTDNCTRVARTAELIMQSRQSNIDPALLYKAVEPTDTHGVARALILDAYARPLMRIPENQITAVATFRNDAFIACMSAKR